MDPTDEQPSKNLRRRKRQEVQKKASTDNLLPLPPAPEASNPPTQNGVTDYRTILSSAYSNLGTSWGHSNTEALSEALQKAKVSEWTTFSYNMSNLPIIPEEICELVKLQQLSFALNKLSVVPDRIRQLTNLVTLNLSENEFSEVPHVIFELKTLTHLNMGGNKITALPLEIENLSLLTTLNLSHNQLSTLPPSIGNLTRLQHLLLYKNAFKTLPSTIGRLTNLWTLYLQQNSLKSLPAEICQLKSLRNLFLQENQLNSLPPAMDQFKDLWWLDVSNNKIDVLPSSLGRLSQTLTDFFFSNNPLSQIPNEILKEVQRNQKKGTNALMKYLRLECAPEVVVSPSSLSADLKTLVNSPHFSDLEVTLALDFAQVRLHKCILAARKQTIKIPFEFDESTTEATALDLRFNDFLSFLTHLYCGKIVGTGEDEELIADLSNLINNPLFSDIQFQVHDQTFNAHKSIISSRCSVFSAMLSGNFQEARKKVIPIPEEITPEIFSEVLQFIYTGKCNINGENVIELLKAANLYQLERMKQMVEVSIVEGIEESNELDLLELAHRYNASQVVSFILHSLSKRPDGLYKEMTNREEYKNLPEEVKHLISEKRFIRSNPFQEIVDPILKPNQKDKEKPHPKNYIGTGGESDSVFRFSTSATFTFVDPVKPKEITPKKKGARPSGKAASRSPSTESSFAFTFEGLNAETTTTTTTTPPTELPFQLKQ